MATKKNIDLESLRGRPLGRVLVKLGKVTKEQIHEALDLQKKHGGPLGQILVENNYISAKDQTLALAYQVGMEYVDLSKIDINPEVIKAIDANIATSYRIIPLDYDPISNYLEIAMASPDNFRATDDLHTLMGDRKSVV